MTVFTHYHLRISRNFNLETSVKKIWNIWWEQEKKSKLKYKRYKPSLFDWFAVFTDMFFKLSKNKLTSLFLQKHSKQSQFMKWNKKVSRKKTSSRDVFRFPGLSAAVQQTFITSLRYFCMEVIETGRKLQREAEERWVQSVGLNGTVSVDLLIACSAKH